MVTARRSTVHELGYGLRRVGLLAWHDVTVGIERESDFCVPETFADQLHVAATDGEPRKMYLYPSTSNSGQFWSGTAIFDFAVESDVGDASKVSGNFKAASAITKAG